MISLPILLALSSNPSCSATPISATFVRIIDGDTFEMDARFVSGTRGQLVLTERLTVRLHGIDTPEMRGLERARGEEAKMFVESWALTYPSVEIYSCDAGKYGRLVAQVCPPANGALCLTEALRVAGYGE